MDMLETLKILASISNDNEAQVYIDMAKQTALNYTNRSELIDSMKYIVVDLAKFYYERNKVGNVKSRSEGAISVSYMDTVEIPKLITSRLDNYRLLHIVQCK